MARNDTSRGAGPWVAALLVLILPATYAAAYVAILDHGLEGFELYDTPLEDDALMYVSTTGCCFTLCRTDHVIIRRIPTYRVDHTSVAYFFWPAHFVDRQIRHEWWEPLSFL